MTPRPRPLLARVIGTLQLKPMSIAQVSRCLSAHRGSVRSVIAALRELDTVRQVGVRRRRRGAPEKLWSLKP